VLQKTPFTFDVSVWELLWPLFAGARLVLVAPGEHRDPSRLVDLVVAHGVTTIHFVPSMLDAFLDAENVMRCDSLRTIVVSGEALRSETQARVFERLPRAMLFNLYGPTEASIDVTHWTCTPASLTAPVPIGHPIRNTVIRVLDRDLNEVPHRVEGELYIGGIGLARGYGGNPGLTAERFVPDPCSSAGARLYRTGDRARRRDDGCLEFLGRVDQQVKIRGFRVELEEIEATLLCHEDVSSAVVIVWNHATGPRVIAYVIARCPSPSGDLVNALKVHARQSLPEYMVPFQFVFLDRLPRLSSGKIDRKALPEPARVQAEYVPARTPLEKQLAAIWQSLLAVEHVGLTDDFFELGGHSLLAVQLMTRIKAEVSVVLPLQAFFRATTLERLVEAVEGAMTRALTDEDAQTLDALLTELEGA
jgi:acyl-coenzyme A synthetase/AMP-(fatty) acid ligase/acyl carrier protein